VFKYLLAVFAALIVAGASAQAQSNIGGVMTSVDGYVSTATGIAVAVLLFVLGRKVIRKLI